jgi:hypothetical protein
MFMSLFLGYNTREIDAVMAAAKAQVSKLDSKNEPVGRIQPKVLNPPAPAAAGAKTKPKAITARRTASKSKKKKAGSK